MRGFSFVRWMRCLGIVGLSALAWGPAAGQSFPTGTVKIVVPFSAGGVADAVARFVSQELTNQWKQAVIVENRPGAGQVVAVQAVAKSAPDGHTLLVTADTTLVANPVLYSKLPYDPHKDLTPIVGLVDITPVLGVQASMPFKSVRELIDYAKANPGKLTYGSPGIGTYSHLSMEDIARRNGVKFTHVPYKGGGPATNAVASGEVSMILLNFASLNPFAKDGKVRILAAAGKTKPESARNMPHVADAGMPGFFTGTWFGMFGPAGMPPALVARINADVIKALDAPKTRQFFATSGFVRIDGSTDDFRKLIAADTKHWGDLIRSVGVKLD